MFTTKHIIQVRKLSRGGLPLVLVVMVLLGMLFNWGGSASLAAPAATEEPLTFNGKVVSTSASGLSKGEPGVTVSLYGMLNQGSQTDLLTSNVTGVDGSFSLWWYGSRYDNYKLVKDDPRGFVPYQAKSINYGKVYDPDMVVFNGDVSGLVDGIEFQMQPPTIFGPPAHSRYLIVTTKAVVPGLSDFIDYKRHLGFEMVVKTVEELDPQNQGGNFRRNAIRNYEIYLKNNGGLRYVLLIGTHDTVPFMAYDPGLPDHSRSFMDWPCPQYPLRIPNNCGWAGDWFYVDLTSNWDSNGDGILGEAFWIDPQLLQTHKNEGHLPPNWQPDQAPGFFVDVYLGRLMMNNSQDVEKALATSMAFEQDSGEWKRSALMAAAFLQLDALVWDKTKNNYINVWAIDTAPDMEKIWKESLLTNGFQRVVMYEKGHPAGNYWPPNNMVVDYPLSAANFNTQGAARDFGLVFAGGHGNETGVFRTWWDKDPDQDYKVEDPNSAGVSEVAGEAYFQRDAWKDLSSPGGKAPVVIVDACGTGSWIEPNNLPTVLQAHGKISAWTGANSTGLSPGPKSQITKKLIADRLPIGEAVWQGMDAYRLKNGLNWGPAAWDWGWINWDLYGDPSMRYWALAPDTASPWPVFGQNAAGTGATSLLGPSGMIRATDWTDIAAPQPGDTWPSPVIGKEGVIVLGDASGAVQAMDSSGNPVWSYQAGGPIVNAPALASSGMVFVKSRDGYLYALEPDGSVAWKRYLGEGDASPKIEPQGLVYAGGSDQLGPGGSPRYFLAGVTAAGEVAKWLFVDGRVNTTPSIEPGGRVWFGTANGSLYSFQDGLLKKFALTPGQALGSGLALANDAQRTVLAPSAAGKLIAFSGLNDAVRWNYTVTPSAALRGAPAVDDQGRVIFGSSYGNLYALSLENGSLLWQAYLYGPVDAAPALDPLYVYAIGGNPATLWTVRRSTGEMVDSLALKSSAVGASSPAISHSRGLFLAADRGFGASLIAIYPYSWSLPPTIVNLTAAPDLKLEMDIDHPEPLLPVVLEKRQPGGDWESLVTLGPDVTHYTDLRIQAGEVYEYRAMTLSATRPGLQAPSVDNRASDYSPVVSIQALPNPPAIPPAPGVTALSSSELRLAWAALGDAAGWIKVLRQAPGESGFSEIAWLPGGAVDFVDRDVQPASSYSYRLKAGNPGGTAPLGPADSGRTFAQTLPPPTGAQASALDNNTFQVCWTPAAANLATLVARQPLGYSRPEPLVTVLAGQTCFTDQDGFASQFKYWVKHVDPASARESTWAAPALVRAPGYRLSGQYLYLPISRK